MPNKRIYGAELMKTGGEWLGAARSYLQWHIPNGDNVTWGSSDMLSMTVYDYENAAAKIAAAALNERNDKVISYIESFIKRLEDQKENNKNPHLTPIINCQIDTLKLILNQIKDEDPTWLMNLSVKE